MSHRCKRSSLDARAEDEILRKFKELSAGRTTVLISHRLSAVRSADRIFFLEKGCLIEQGTHDELLALGGGYSKLYQLQATQYQ